MGKARHEQGDFAPFAHKMLVNGSKLYHFIKLYINLVDGDQKTCAASLQLDEQILHARTPIVGWLIPLPEPDVNHLRDTYSCKAGLVFDVDQMGRLFANAYLDIVKHAGKGGNASRDPSVLLGLMGEQGEQSRFSRASGTGDDRSELRFALFAAKSSD